MTVAVKPFVRWLATWHNKISMLTSFNPLLLSVSFFSGKITGFQDYDFRVLVKSAFVIRIGIWTIFDFLALLAKIPRFMQISKSRKLNNLLWFQLCRLQWNLLVSWIQSGILARLAWYTLFDASYSLFKTYLLSKARGFCYLFATFYFHCNL